MLDRLRSHSFSYQAPVLVCLLAILLLLVLPTGFEGALIYQEAERCTARVLETDNSAIIDTGLVRSGEQRCQLEILDGRFQGRTVTGINMLNGSLEQDKLFSPGDRAQVVVSHDGDTITNVTMSDHYRLGWEALMAAGFALFLILFAGRTGVRAIASFVLTVLCLVEAPGPPLPHGLEPHLGRAGHHPLSHHFDHRSGVRALTGGAGRRYPAPFLASWSPVCWASSLPTCSRSTGQ